MITGRTLFRDNIAGALLLSNISGWGARTIHRKETYTKKNLDFFSCSFRVPSWIVLNWFPLKNRDHLRGDVLKSFPVALPNHLHEEM